MNIISPIDVLTSFLHKAVYKVVLDWGKYFVKPNKKVLVFESFPDYSDNSRAFSDYLIKERKYKIYWIVKDAKSFAKRFQNSRIHFLQEVDKNGIGSVWTLLVLLRAGWMFSTHGFTYAPGSQKGKKYIKLWHGCSFKDKTPQASFTEFDLALVAGPCFIKTKAYFWGCSESKIIAKGYPRYDWLRMKSNKVESVVNLWKQRNKKMIVWMPTFRNDKYNLHNESAIITQFPLMENTVQWNKLDNLCENYSILLVIKLHPFQKDYQINYAHLSNIKMMTNDDLEVNNIQLYEFLGYSDALITDYSSVGVDYLIVDNPIAYTLDDYEVYKKTRGFVFDDPREYMPGSHLYKYRDLEKFIADIANNKDDFREKRNSVKKQLVYESENYCQDIAKELNL